MKICILSKADSFGGGASKCAEDLSIQLNSAGYEAKHFCYWAGKGFNENRTPLINRFYKIIYLYREKIEKKIFGLPEFIPFELPFLLRNGILGYDIIHFHDICSAISPLTIYYLAKRKPVAWTFHDCSPFTGGCLYPMACQKFKTKCIDCRHKEWPIDSAFTKTRFLQYIKKRIFNDTDITVISPSKWMADTAYSSFVLNKKPYVINNGVDLSLFQPINKKEARRDLSIPDNRYIILLSAAFFSDKRKGLNFAAASIKKIKNLKPYIVIMGSCSKEIDVILRGMEIHKFGYQSNQKIINKIYASADVFLFPSLADNQPLSILEAFASGTPVVSFATGGIPEMIDENTGMVVMQKDIESLSKALRTFNNIEYSTKCSESARKLVQQKYSASTYLNNHIDLYKKMIGRNL